MSVTPQIQAFFDETTNTVSYLVSDPGTKRAAVIDPVLDYDPKSGKLSTGSARKILDAASRQGLSIVWILETHAHADHLSAAPLFKRETGAPIGIGARIDQVQQIFRPRFNLEDVSGDGSEFDHLFHEGEIFSVGALEFEVLHTPGHTPACLTYRVADALFVGDTLFMPDYGTARADFPGGSARTLYRSIQRLLSFPEETRIFLCHDYKPEGRSVYVWETTVGEQLANNVHVHRGVGEEEFVRMREKRDAGLDAPVLLLPSIQVNIRAGALPRAESNGVQYLKIPLTVPGEIAELTDVERIPRDRALGG